MNSELSLQGWTGIFRVQPCLAQSSRISMERTSDQRVSVGEILILLFAGALAAISVGLLHLQIRIPGHAILRAALPLAMGLALVPRHSAGKIMAIGAAFTVAAMSAAQIAVFPHAAVFSVLVLGPVLDLALRGNAQGWALYARFAAAGGIANLLAYVLKIATVQIGWSAAGGRHFAEFGIVALSSFILCGALAGLVAGVLAFRFRAADDLRRD